MTKKQCINEIREALVVRHGMYCTGLQGLKVSTLRDLANLLRYDPDFVYWCLSVNAWGCKVYYL